MIRIRYKNGKIENLPEDAVFVEVCDLLGDPAVVIFSDAYGQVRAIAAGSPEMKRYEKLFGEKSSIVEDVSGLFVPMEAAARG